MAGHRFTEQRSPMCGKIASENNLSTKTRASIADTPGMTCRVKFPVSDMTELESYLKCCMCSHVHEVSTVDKRNESRLCSSKKCCCGCCTPVEICLTGVKIAGLDGYAQSDLIAETRSFSTWPPD